MRIPPPVGLALDLALVLVFVLLGRSSHRESDALAGLWRTAWPFLVGLGLGWVAVMAMWRTWPVPTPREALGAVLRRGSVVLGGTVVTGMLLRAVSRQGVAASFVLVATLVLAIFLLGWRALAFAAGRRPRHR